jgi:hypothetical protein
MSEASAAELTRQSMAVGGWSTALVMYYSRSSNPPPRRTQKPHIGYSYDRMVECSHFLQ